MHEGRVSVEQVNSTMNRFWPTEFAEEWDRPGLQIGTLGGEVSGVLLVVDVTLGTVREAIERGANLIISHHPFLLRGIFSVNEDDEKGQIIALCNRERISVLCAHTNADSALGGVSDVLADVISLTECVPIQFGEGAPNGTLHGIGRVGGLSNPVSLDGLVQRLAHALPATTSGIRVSGDPDALVHTVALCGGAGDSLLTAEGVTASDVYITSDLRHHPALDAAERRRLGRGPALIDISHWAGESLWLSRARDQLGGVFSRIPITVSTLSTDPWDFVVIDNREVSQ